MARSKWGILMPLVAAVLCTGLYAQSASGIVAEASKQSDLGEQAGEQPTRLQSAAPQSGISSSTATTMTGSEIESLPANGRHWEEWAVAAPADSAQVNGSSSGFGLTRSYDLSVDGVSLRLAFGSTSAPSSNSSALTSSGQGVAEPSGMGRTWSGGHGFAVSEAAASEVVSGVADNGGSRAPSRTTIQTRRGGDALHGQVFIFDRQHLMSAQNPSSVWVQESAPATYATVPVFTSTPYSPSEYELRWGFGIGSRIPHRKIFWFSALDGNNSSKPGVSTVRWPANFFAQPSNDQVQVLGAQLGTNNTTALARYSTLLETLGGLLGPVHRTGNQLTGFGRLDWQTGDRHHFTVEGSGAHWTSPGGGFSRVNENYGNHSFGTSNASQQWMLGRWEAFITPNLLAVTQASTGRTVQGVHATAASAFEQTLNQNVWGQLPQIVIDSRYGFTIGNPSRFGRGSYPDERFTRIDQSLNWIHGSLLVKAGASYSFDSDHISLLRNRTGTYYYPTLASFASDALVFQTYGLIDALDPFNQHNCDQVGKPWRDSAGVLRGLGYLPCYSYYSQTMGPDTWAISTDDWSGYATAQWQPNKVFVFSAGLRWDRQVLPPALPNLKNPDLPLAGQLPKTGNNWGPRLSLAIGRSENHLPVLRIGYGLYYARIENGPLFAALTQTGSVNGVLNFFMRPTDNLNSGGAPPFPYVFAGEPLTMVKPGVLAYATGYRNPEIHQAVAGFEESLPGRFMLTANAMVSLGRRLPISVDTNFDSRVNPQTMTYVVVDGTGKGPIKASTLTVPLYADWASSSSPSSAQGRLNPNYQQITQIASRANSTYEAAMIRLTHNGRRGLSINARYIYGHAMDWNPNESSSVTGSDVLDPKDFHHEYGVSNLDARHTLAASLIFNSPWTLRNAARYFANDWRVSGVGSFHSGMPYTMRTSGSVPRVVSLASHTSYTGLGPGINGSGGDNRIYGVGNDGISYDIGRNTYRYPCAWKADVRLSKLIPIRKMTQLELLGETFNLFNHRNVTQIETTGYSIESGGLNGSFPTLTYLTGLKANTTAFGQPLNSNSTSYYRERQFQFGLRMKF